MLDNAASAPYTRIGDANRIHSIAIIPFLRAGLHAIHRHFRGDIVKTRVLWSILLLALSATVIPFSSVADAQPDNEKKFLLLYFKEEELVVESPTRGKKSLTQVAENVTVITSADIKLMNAHTIADVLNTVTGVQIFKTGGPGSMSQTSIQGSESRQVAVFMDGILLNNLGSNVTDIGSFPVQSIDRIEIIKGPASSAWGSALGGVINVITKSGAGDKPSGLVSASYGERNAGDYRVETSGREKRFGYYLSAGRLETNGFRQHNDFSGDNVYTKLTYDLTEKTSMQFTLWNSRYGQGVLDFPVYDLFIRNKMDTLTSSLSLNTAISTETELSVSVWQLRQDFDNLNYQLSSGSELSKDVYNDRGYGASVKLMSRHESHNVVLGADLDDRTLDANTLAGTKHALRKQAVYVNDTMSFDRFTVTPGIRRDSTDTNGDFTSPSLGMTFKLADDVLFRAYAGRGFNIPPLAATYGDNAFYVSNPDLKMEHVRSYQTGVETTAVPGLWIKVSFFRNEITDAIENVAVSNTASTWINQGSARKQGLETEFKTTPVYHTSLLAGVAFMKAKNLDTSEQIPNIARRTYDIGLLYDNDSWNAQVRGHAIDWNADPRFNAKYGAMIVDLHAAKRIIARKDGTVETFLTVNNVFDGSQYLVDVYKNPKRWFEAGLRYAF